MRKRLYLAALTAALTLGAAATSYAAQWVPDTNGWRMTEAGLPIPGNGLTEIRMEWRSATILGRMDISTHLLQLRMVTR